MNRKFQCHTNLFLNSELIQLNLNSFSSLRDHNENRAFLLALCILAISNLISTPLFVFISASTNFNDLTCLILILQLMLIHFSCSNHKIFFKGATKMYFMYYSRVVSTLFSAGLHKSAFSTYSFDKTRFSSFFVSVSLAFNFWFCCKT